MENKGYIHLPYIIRTDKTKINNETVWYRNKFKNFLLKIRFFFIKPKYMKHIGKYVNIDRSKYGIIKITNYG